MDTFTDDQNQVLRRDERLRFWCQSVPWALSLIGIGFLIGAVFTVVEIQQLVEAFDWSQICNA